MSGVLLWSVWMQCSTDVEKLSSRPSLLVENPKKTLIWNFIFAEISKCVSAGGRHFTFSMSDTVLGTNTGMAWAGRASFFLCGSFSLNCRGGKRIQTYEQDRNGHNTLSKTVREAFKIKKGQKYWCVVMSPPPPITPNALTNFLNLGIF